MTELKPIKEGKVREIYDNGDSLIRELYLHRCQNSGLI